MWGTPADWSAAGMEDSWGDWDDGVIAGKVASNDAGISAEAEPVAEVCSGADAFKEGVAAAPTGGFADDAEVETTTDMPTAGGSVAVASAGVAEAESMADMLNGTTGGAPFVGSESGVKGPGGEDSLGSTTFLNRLSQMASELRGSLSGAAVCWSSVTGKRDWALVQIESAAVASGIPGKPSWLLCASWTGFKSDVC